MAPPLAFPFESLAVRRQVVAAIGLAVVIAGTFVFAKKASRERDSISAAEIGLGLIQAALAMKMISSGMLEFGGAAIGVWLGMWYMRFYCLPKWFIDPARRIDAVAWAMTAGLFVVAVSSYYVYLRSPGGAMATHGRLNGITGNAQHLGLALASSIAAPVYLLKKYRSRGFAQQVSFLAVILLTAYLVLLTGSRMAAAGLALAVVLQMKPRLIIPCLFASLLAGLLAEPILAIIREDQYLSTITRTNNTRGDVWMTQWRQFTANPAFGVTLRGDRLGFAESSWLGLLATVGVVGIPGMLVFLFGLSQDVYKLWRKGLKFQGEGSAELMFIAAGMSSLLFCSFFEAFMLGTITMALTTVYYYGFALSGLKRLRVV
ncbi:hypothetical protein [Rhodopirellula europaea]|uniref:hypothetical protein n=2 Tax=Rhodopirellula TaxID=265488 RepID=UPI0030EE850C